MEMVILCAALLAPSGICTTQVVAPPPTLPIVSIRSVQITIPALPVQQDIVISNSARGSQGAGR